MLVNDFVLDDSCVLTSISFPCEVPTLLFSGPPFQGALPCEPTPTLVELVAIPVTPPAMANCEYCGASSEQADPVVHSRAIMWKYYVVKQDLNSYASGNCCYWCSIAQHEVDEYLPLTRSLYIKSVRKKLAAAVGSRLGDESQLGGGHPVDATGSQLGEDSPRGRGGQQDETNQLWEESQHGEGQPDVCSPPVDASQLGGGLPIAETGSQLGEDSQRGGGGLPDESSQLAKDSQFGTGQPDVRSQLGEDSHLPEGRKRKACHRQDLFEEDASGH
jgi:hypothetical protein